MGFGNFLGEFAKGFAKGYVEERGAKGTIQDVSDLLSGIFGNSDSSAADEADWDELFKDINDLMDNGEYNEALELLDEFYHDNMNSEPDALYYYQRGDILLGFLNDSIGEDYFDEINESLCECIVEGKEFNVLNKEFRDLEKERRAIVRRNR